MHPPQRNLKFILISSLCAALALGGCGGGGGASAEGTATPSAMTAVTAVAPVNPMVGVAQAPTAAPAVAADWTGPPAEASPPAAKTLSVNAPTVADSIAAALATAAAVPPEGRVIALQAAGSPDGTNAVGVGQATSVDIFVTLAGDDRWSGNLSVPNALRTDGPLRTLTAAQMVVRQRLASMSAGSSARLPINVRIGAGEYRLTEPLALGVADSGAPGAPVVYRAETYGTVTLSGAVRVASATGPAIGTLMSLPVPPLDTATIRGGNQMFVNGQRATLARSPNAGSFWFVNKALPLAEEPAAAKGQEAFVPPPEALALLNGLGPNERSQAIIQVMQEWTSGWHRLSSSPAPAGGVRISPRAYWPFLQAGVNQRFFVENTAAALDAPGEWLWDASGLKYIATVADVGKALAFEMPQLDRLLLISGNAVTNVFAQDIEFRGIEFSYTRRLTPDAGYIDNQAANAIGAAIEVDAARRIVFDACTVSRTGGYGIWLRTAVRESRITNSKLTDLGAGGVKVGAVTVWPEGNLNTGLNTVSSNVITGTGKLIPGAVGVWIGRSSDNTVSNNLIANTSYSGISVGWKWGFGGTTASGNKVTNNLLINIGQGQLSDLAAIYTLGESPGTVISGNVIHAVRAYPGYGAGSFGLYNDAGSSNILWENNVVVGTDDGGYLLNQGRNNTVRDNLLAYGEHREVRLAITDPATNTNFTGNLLIPKVGVPFDALATAPDFVYTANRVSNRVLTGALDLTRCNGGCSLSSAMLTVGSDPRLIALTNADAATAARVAATALAAGPQGLAARQIPAVNTVLPAPASAPPINYETEIGDTAIGGQPYSLTYRTGNNPAAIAVQAATGTPSGKCLKFTDAATMVNSWDPHAWATLNHTNGVSTVEYSIQIDAATDFMHEWRDNKQAPYLTGPALRIRSTGIEANGRIVAPAPLGQWISIKITAPLDTAAGRWTLDVKQGAGAYTRIGDYPNRDAAWKTMTWLGFVSSARVASSYCIGFIKADTTGR